MNCPLSFLKDASFLQLNSMYGMPALGFPGDQPAVGCTVNGAREAVWTLTKRYNRGGYNKP
jgi:hypothetical protein